MEISQKQREYIKKSFQKMRTKEDLLHLLNYVKHLLYGDKSYPFELRQVNYYISTKNHSKRYKQFSIKKKSGGDRYIYAPTEGLKAIQNCLRVILQIMYDPHPAATGFVPKKSIVDNASVHLNSLYVYNIDLKDFFPSIDQARIWGRLRYPPFNLNGRSKKGQLANIISVLCCQEIEVDRMDDKGNWIQINKYVLPQGAPTSPIISNIICQKLDFYLSAAAKRFGVRYSRYADDITFSSMHNVYHDGSEFLKEAQRIIKDQNFHINEKKTRLQREAFRQEVTGLVVNVKTNVPQRYLKELRKWLYYWESYGYDRAFSYFLPKYKKDKGHVKRGNPNMVNILDGKLNYLKMVKGADDSTYSKLKQRFEALKQQLPIYQFEGIKDINKMKIDPDPIATRDFLTNFKYSNELSFKDLVHKPTDENDFDFVNILNKANKEFVELSKTLDDRLKLPSNVISKTQELLKLLSKEGVKFFSENKKHPLESIVIGSKIQEFKRDYRFGNEKAESSILTDLIKNVANKRSFEHYSLGENIIYSFGDSDNSRIFDIKQIVFEPNLVEFRSKANFFTWVPNVRSAFSVMFDAILKHSNIGGKRPFSAHQKKIAVRINKELVGDRIKINLTFCDEESTCLGNLDKMMENVKKDYFKTLAGICDFKVQFPTMQGDSYECRILPFSQGLEKLTNPVSGFSYVYSFYD